MAHLEGGGLGGQCVVYLPVLRAVVGHRTAETSGDSERLLVAEPGWIRLSPGLWHLPAGLGFHLRLPVHLGSLHPQLDHRTSVEAWSKDVPRLSRSGWGLGQFLPDLRLQAAPDRKQARGKTMKP